MKNVAFERSGAALTIKLDGHIDSANAPQIEEAINAAITPDITNVTVDCENLEYITVDCENLDYISSAGLRVILRVKKKVADTVVVNVSSDVYEIFDMTGFTEMMDIRKAYRRISVDGCEVIGQGANGKVYRIDRDTIVKVYMNPDSLADIHRERELARKAFVRGVPTAIPYDVVRVGDHYGSVFELLNAKSFAKLLIENLAGVDEVVKMSVDLLKKIHSTELDPGDLPDIRTDGIKWAEFLEPYLPAEDHQKLLALFKAIPEDHHMMHGDYHLKNLMLQDGEALLIDMDTICTGNPVFEFGSIFKAYVGYSELDPTIVEQFLGIKAPIAREIWDKTVRMYFDGRDEDFIKSAKNKAMIVGYTRVMRRAIRHGGLENETGLKEIENCRQRLHTLLSEVDSLAF